MGRLDGELAIVTGAASGIGEATARLFVAEGARMVLADVDASRGERLAAELGERAAFVPTDVSREADVDTVVNTCLRTFGGLDVMFNNAGVPEAGSIEDIDVASRERTFGVNVRGVFLGIRAAARVMHPQGQGSRRRAAHRVAATQPADCGPGGDAARGHRAVGSLTDIGRTRLQLPLEHEHGPAGTVVVGYRARHGEAQRTVESSRSDIRWRGDRRHDGASVRSRDPEELFVQPPAVATAPNCRADADEVDVRPVRLRGRQDANQERVRPALPVDYQAGPVEQVEEQPGERPQHWPAPPVIHDARDGVVISRRRRPRGHRFHAAIIGRRHHLVHAGTGRATESQRAGQRYATHSTGAAAQGMVIGKDASRRTQSHHRRQ
jgi:short chain dehydrogenase